MSTLITGYEEFSLDLTSSIMNSSSIAPNNGLRTSEMAFPAILRGEGCH